MGNVHCLCSLGTAVVGAAEESCWKLIFFLTNMSLNVQEWKSSGGQIKLSWFLRFCIRKIWRSGMYLWWCKIDCLVLLRAGPILSVNLPPLLWACQEDTGKICEPLGQNQKRMIRKVAQHCFSVSEPVPWELLPLCANLLFAAAAVLHPSSSTGVITGVTQAVSSWKLLPLFPLLC